VPLMLVISWHGARATYLLEAMRLESAVDFIRLALVTSVGPYIFTRF